MSGAAAVSAAALVSDDASDPHEASITKAPTARAQAANRAEVPLERRMTATVSAPVVRYERGERRTLAG